MNHHDQNDYYSSSESDNDNELLELREIKKEFENVEEYISIMNDAVNHEWILEKNAKKSLSIQDLLLDFYHESSYKKKDVEYYNWITKFPCPHNIMKGDGIVYNNQRVNIGDTVKIEWEFEDVYHSNLPSNFIFMKGTVFRIENDIIHAVFPLKISLYPPDFVNDKNTKPERVQYYVTFKPSKTMMMRKFAAVHRLKILDKRISNFIICKSKPVEKLNFVYIDEMSKINFSQQSAIKKALGNNVTLIQGPPGCGKTHVISAIIKQHLTNFPEEKIIVCGPTNVSIENLVTAINEAIKPINQEAIWFASEEAELKSLKNLTNVQMSQSLYKMLKNVSVNGKEFSKLKEKSWERPLYPDERASLSKLRNQLENEILERNSVIICTLGSSGKKLIRDFGFPTVIIDEATQCLEPLSLMPLSEKTRRFILVGDQKQLGPSLIDCPDLVKIHYDRSLFDRMIMKYNNSYNYAFLDCQYRMHPTICDFPNKRFYRGKIQNGIKMNDRTGIIPPVSFIDVKGIEKINNKSFMNIEEANQIMGILRSLFEKGIMGYQIGIISPYGAQTKLLQHKIRLISNSSDVKIESVDSFQGNERDYIIVSLTRTNMSSFFTSPRRVNVALTRSRLGLVLVGNLSALLANESIWTDYCKYCISNKFVRSHLGTIEKPKKEKLDIKSPILCPFDSGDKGLKLKEIPISITGGKSVIIWPDSGTDIDRLKSWTQNLINIVSSGKYVTLAMEAEKICIQLSSIFDENYDLFGEERDNVPEIGNCNGVIIMLYQKNGKSMSDDTISKVLSPLLYHKNVSIVTYDAAFRLAILNEFNIKMNTNRLFDSHSALIPINTNEKNEFFKDHSFCNAIDEIKCEDSHTDKSKEWAMKGLKTFPMYYNMFIIKNRQIPNISNASKMFLESCANDIPLIALICKDMIQKGLRENAILMTQQKLIEFSIHSFPYLYRQSLNMCLDISETIQCSLETSHDTSYLLTLWKKHNDIIEIFKKEPRYYFETLRLNNSHIDEIKSRIKLAERILLESHPHESIIYSNIKLVEPLNYNFDPFKGFI